MPNYFRGSEFKLSIHDGASFIEIACMRSNTSSRNNEAIDVTSKCTMPWRTSVNGGLQTVTFSGSGVMNDGADMTAVINAYNNNLITRFKMESEFGDVYDGLFTPTSFERGGEHSAEETFDLTLESAGPIIYTSPVLLPMMIAIPPVVSGAWTIVGYATSPKVYSWNIISPIEWSTV